jgi:hypothetical protein
VFDQFLFAFFIPVLLLCPIFPPFLGFFHSPFRISLDLFFLNPFLREDHQELQYLLNYRNYLRISLQIIPARLNKQLLLKVASRLEGSKNEYITGGGQKIAVTRRVDIYEKEGNVTKSAKPKNKDNLKNNVFVQQQALLGVSNNHSSKGPANTAGSAVAMTGKKRPNSHAALRDVKMIRLPSEEIRQLASGPSDPFAPRPATAPTSVNNYGSAVSGIRKVSDGTVSDDHSDDGTSLSAHHSYNSNSQYQQHYQQNSSSALSSRGPSLGFLSSNDSILSAILNTSQPHAADCIESLDDLMEFCRSDTLVDNLLPSSSSNAASVPFSSSSNSSSLGPNLSEPAQIPISAISSFPPTLQRAASDVLDRLLSEGNEFWKEILPSTTSYLTSAASDEGSRGEEGTPYTSNNGGGGIDLSSAISYLPASRTNSTIIVSGDDGSQFQSYTSMSGIISENEVQYLNQGTVSQQYQYQPGNDIQVEMPADAPELPAPMQLLRSVSWDVYNGSFTEDLKLYLESTPSTN